MQAGTTNDIVVLTLYQSDGVTPFVTTNYTSVVVAIKYPNGTTAQVTPLSVVANVVEVNTTPTLFPVDGAHQVQVIVTFADGTISKSKIIGLAVDPSLV